MQRIISALNKEKKTGDLKKGNQKTFDKSKYMQYSYQFYD